VSTPRLSMKFASIERDIITVYVNKKTARECYVASLRLGPTKPEIEKHRKKARGKEESQKCERDRSGSKSGSCMTGARRRRGPNRTKR